MGIVVVKWLTTPTRFHELEELKRVATTFLHSQNCGGGDDDDD